MKCIYIYNPKSGNKQHNKKKDYIIKQLLTRYEIVDVKQTEKIGDAGKFAKEACGIYDAIIVAGGDGTLNEVINGISPMENRPRIGYIPAGTTNDVASSLKIPKNIKKALKIIIKGNTRQCNIFKVNEKYGFYVCAFGLFTASSYTTDQKQKNAFGKLAYVFSGIKELGTTKKFPFHIISEKLEIKTDIILGIFANGRYVSGFKINDSNFNNDNVCLVVFVEKNKKSVSLKSLFTIFKLFLFGATSIEKVKNCVVIPINKCRIELEENTPVNIDGEKGLEGSFDFEVIKNHIEIFIK